MKRENEVNLLDKYETCKNCKRECLSQVYCIECIRDKLRNDFDKWTSGNEAINQFVQNCQMKTRAPDKIFEWIPPEEIINIKLLAKGGFSTIYYADWTNGPISHWDCETRKFHRTGTENIILKSLDNSSDPNVDFTKIFKEVSIYVICKIL